jgi:hypothetical protein
MRRDQREYASCASFFEETMRSRLTQAADVRFRRIRIHQTTLIASNQVILAAARELQVAS